MANIAQGKAECYISIKARCQVIHGIGNRDNTGTPYLQINYITSFARYKSHINV